MRIMKKRKPAVYPQLVCWELKKLWQMRFYEVMNTDELL